MLRFSVSRRQSKYTFSNTEKYWEKNLPRKYHVRFFFLSDNFNIQQVAVPFYVIPGRIQGSRQTRHGDVVFSSIYRECVAAPLQLTLENSLKIREYSNMSRIRPTFQKRDHSSTDDCLPHVLQRVFVRVRMLVHVLHREFVRVRILVHVLQRVFVRARTHTCPIFLRGYSSIPASDEYSPRVFWEGIRLSNIFLTKLTRSQRIRIPVSVRSRAGCEILPSDTRWRTAAATTAL